MLGLGVQELTIILIIVIVLFGASRLPELGKGVGSFVKNLKRGLNEPEEIDVTPKEKIKEEDKTTKKEEKKD
ncbi:MAG: twin-arginine translocase TatA/TatE family subunit [Candidatus Magnetoovum sp. WYHC-5]|nr:twin-arginine translocase TatA/TatE family subunit [Candidatus Magnetoovum sp. WYHC-5]